MSFIGVALTGLGRVLASPGLVVWLWVTNVVVALPLATMMSGAIGESIGQSLVHERLSRGFDMGWYGEYQAQAKGLARTFTPTVVGVGAFFNNIEAWLNGKMFEGLPGLVGIGIVYALLWTLFLGGILDRYGSREGIFNLERFFSRGGEFFSVFCVWPSSPPPSTTASIAFRAGFSVLSKRTRVTRQWRGPF